MDPDDLQRLIDAGLYDPAAPGADERLALVELLADLGATVDDMLSVGAVPGGLAGLASIAARPKPTVTLRQLAERSGVSLAVTTERWHAVGLAATSPDVPLLSEDEAAQLVLLARSVDLLDAERALQVLRATGHAIARLADSLVQAYVVGVEGAVDGELDRARLGAVMSASLAGAMAGFEAILVRQMSQSAIRLRSGLSADRSETTLTVGFVDLVGFTSMAQAAASTDLERLLASFEAVASAAVAAHDGWIVKLIGDAVMFAALSADQGVGIAAHLVSAIGVDRPELEVRGGLATGPVLARSGDYFGPVVNLAARAQSAAIEGEVLVDAATAEAATPPEGFVLEPAGRRRLRGITEPVRLWSLHAGSADRPAPPSSTP